MDVEKKIVLHSAIWDLHIHTCQCPKASSEFKNLEVKDYISKLLEVFKNYQDLEMISFTDHNRISIDVYKEFYSRKIDIKLIPGIEIDVKLDNSSNVKHLIVYFNLNETNFEEFAKSLNEFLDKKVPIEIEKLLNYLVENRIEFVLSPHAFKQGERGLDSDWTTPEIVKEKSHKYMDQFFCFWEASGQSYIANATKFLRDFDLENRISIISFSDSNNFKKLESYLNSPTQYFNCLPCFKGIQLAGTDCRRIVKKYEKIDDSNLGNLIGKINFGGTDIKLSPKLNVIVGGRGSGKSLLLDSMALNLNPKLDEENKMLKENRKDYIENFKISIENYDGIVFKPGTLNFDYFNQSYVSKIFDNPDPSEAISNYFKDEFDTIKDIDKDEIMSSLKQKYKETLQSAKCEQLDNISSLSEKYIISKNSKIKMNIAKKDLAKETTIAYPEYEAAVLNILNNKKIVPKEISDSTNIRKKIVELMKTVYQEIAEYNDKIIINTGRNHFINTYIEYNKNISQSEKDKIEIEDLFNLHLSQKQSKYINRVSIINSLLSLNDNFKAFYNEVSTKEGVHNTTFIFEKSLTIETPIEFFVRISKKYLSGKKINFNNLEDVINAFCYNIDKYIKESKIIDNYIKELENLDNILTISKNTIYYSINGENPEDIFEASPGTQTNILMEYIVSKDSKVPLLIDQPEDNIDNETIFTKLTDWFYTLKSKRQIIVVTHDANIVINSDAENVIIANKKNKDMFNYDYGALEFGKILSKISIILDGGIDAVERRLKKYGREDKWAK